MKLKEISISPGIIYIIIRYFTYLIQFINSILLATKLGELSFGIYSFILLFMQYFSYTNLGINESLNVEGVLAKTNNEAFQKIWDTSFITNLLLSLCAIILLITISFFSNIFNKYEYDSYKYILISLCFIVNINIIFVTYYKLFGALYKINIYQFLPHALIFVYILFNKFININIIILFLFGANLFSLILFLITPPTQIKFQFSRKISIQLIKRGIALLVYNLSHIFIKTSISTLISIFFTITLFGAFTFINNLSNAIIMATGAFMFIFYPKILAKFSQSKTVEETNEWIKRINNSYIVACNLIALFSTLALPLLEIVAPTYKNYFYMYYLLVAAQIMINNSSAYSSMLITHNKEQILMKFGIITVIIETILGLINGLLIKNITFMPIIIIIGGFLYTFLIVNYVYEYTENENIKLKSTFQGTFIPIVFLFLACFSSFSFLFSLLSIISYVIINYHKKDFFFKIAKKVIIDKDLLKI